MFEIFDLQNPTAKVQLLLGTCVSSSTLSWVLVIFINLDSRSATAFFGSKV